MKKQLSDSDKKYAFVTTLPKLMQNISLREKKVFFVLLNFSLYCLCLY